ncbi:hypothetical protein HHK36_016642 [Tetracentron sinense]|uniref:Protein kinase domain-containing protein n=1 Tax=Tetracentron sinense TaxID=13715 RepID=A0A834Z137_TETSI|nr:hypothetical protein HHK36_016642 [Tetracentron sinense]
MKCFFFSSGEKKDESKTTKSISVQSAVSTSTDREPKTTKSISVQSAASTSTDREMKRSGSEFNSQDEPKTTKSILVQSAASTSTDREMKRTGSEFNSQDVSDISIESSRKSPFHSLSQRPNNLRVFTFSELKTATRNFDNSLVIGEGGFGRVYKGVIRSSGDSRTKLDVAVKQLSRRGSQASPITIAKIDPSNAALLNTDIFVLYLAQIIFRDFKSSNILLDDQWNAKLSDFGMVRLGPSEGLTHVSTAVVGTMGYVAPEYIQTGRLRANGDVWSYGVFLFVLITGRHPLDRNLPKSEQKLLEWVRPYVSDIKKFPLILDPRLEGKYSIKSAQKLASLANRCLARNPKARPKMSEVLEIVQQIREEAEMGSPQDPAETSEEFKRKDPGIVDSRAGESVWSVWRLWTPRPVRTC